MSFILGAALGIFVFAIFSSRAIKWNKERINRSYSYPLFPNCLITRHPVVFLSGKKSLYYFGRYWNFIPQFLLDHGYEVIDLDLPWRDEKQRTKELLRFLQILKEEDLAAHFVADITSAKLMETGKAQYPELFMSTNIMTLKDISIPASGSEPLAFRLHRFFTGRNEHLDGRILGLTEVSELKDVGRIYLRKMVELAESDLQHGETQHEPGRVTQPQL